MAFVEIRFPEEISYGATGGPEYSTDIIELNSGHEQRNSNWSASRMRYNVSHGVKTQEQMDELIAFFRARRGKAIGFRYKDFADYEAEGQVLGDGDGNETEFQLIKTYTDGSVTTTRTITKPVNATVSVYIESVLQDPEDYTIDYTTGIITFDTAPGDGDEVSADFQFDVPVRFDTDSLASSVIAFERYSWNDIPLVEVRVD